MNDCVKRISFTVDNKVYPLIFDSKEISIVTALQEDINILFFQKNSYYQNKLDKETIYFLLIIDLLTIHNENHSNYIMELTKEVKLIISKIDFVL